MCYLVKECQPLHLWISVLLNLDGAVVIRDDPELAEIFLLNDLVDDRTNLNLFGQTTNQVQRSAL